MPCSVRRSVRTLSAHMITSCPPPCDRRTFLKTLVGGAAGASCWSAGFSARAQTPLSSLASLPLGDNLQLIQGAGGNVVALRSADGILLIDGGDAAHSHALLEMITDRSRVQALINTHWHPEQTGSNERLGKAGARIIAHENTKLWLGAEVNVEWQQKVYPPQPVAALPTETLYTKATLQFGGDALEYGYLPQAHTDGDLYVFLPARNVLIVGDVMAGGRYPFPDWSTGGWIGGMVNATRTLLDMADASTRIVPGLGPVQTRADLQAQFDMLDTVRGRLVGMLKQGMSTDEMLAGQPTSEFDAKWGDPTRLIVNAYPGLWGHVRELGGIL